MQIELKEIQLEVGITFIYVTHDQEEALTMSDRIAVFSQGRIKQVGAPADVYERPATRFVAGFVGTSNLISGDTAEAITGRRGLFTVRPEKIHLVDPETPVGADEYTAPGRIRSVVYLGSDTRCYVALDAGGELVVTQQNAADPRPAAPDRNARWATREELPAPAVLAGARSGLHYQGHRLAPSATTATSSTRTGSSGVIVATRRRARSPIGDLLARSRRASMAARRSLRGCPIEPCGSRSVTTPAYLPLIPDPPIVGRRMIGARRTACTGNLVP
jgi:hypothetical protein